MQQQHAISPSTSSVDPGSNQWDARLYDDKHSFVWKQGTSLLDLLAMMPGERILDLGCGTGHLTAQIATAGAEVIGLDSAPTMIEQARQTYPHLHFEVGDARHFSFAEPFDAVFSNAVLHWIKDPQEVIGCVRRALKPRGRFVAEFGGQGNVKAIVAAIEKVTQATGCGTFENPWYFPNIADYSILLAQAGLEITYATLFDRPTPLEGETGMRHWIEMFANDLLTKVGSDKREYFFGHVEKELRPILYREGTWFADYRRLRVAARRLN
jgi:trans-aconitate methyltransferase